MFHALAATFLSDATEPSHNHHSGHFLLQVFSVFMHLQYTAKNGAQADSTKLQETCAAAEAVTEAELLQLGLPVLRSDILFTKLEDTVVNTHVCTVDNT